MSELESVYGDVLYYTEVPCLSRSYPKLRSRTPLLLTLLESSYQFELAELQNCNVVKDALKPNSLIDFYASLPNDTYPNIKKHT